MIENLSNKKLLLLEDSDEFIENVTSLFNMFVKQTIIAKNIKDAFNILENEKIDIIISDINLKNENGLDFIKEYRKINKEIPIAVLSGHKDEELLFRAMTLNLSGYLLKPVNFKSLIEVFTNCANKLLANNLTTITLKDGYVYNKEQKKLSRDLESFILNKKEIQFFDMLSENKNKIITKNMILHSVYEDGNASDASLNNFIMKIRKRFGKSFLHTIPNVGYKMVL